jgi:hypothetical protein
MSYVNARESRGPQAIAADDFDDGRGGDDRAPGSTRRPPPLTVQPSQPVHPGGSVRPRVTRAPLPRLELPIKAGQVQFSPAGPTRATTLFPIPGFLPRPTIVRGPRTPAVIVRPRIPGIKPMPGSPPILSVPTVPGALIKPKLPEIVMTPPIMAPRPGAIVPVSTPSTGGGPSPGMFPQRPRPELIKPNLELDTIDVRELVQPAPAPAGMSKKTKIVIAAAAGVAALGVVYLVTQGKKKQP